MNETGYQINQCETLLDFYKRIDYFTEYTKFYYYKKYQLPNTDDKDIYKMFETDFLNNRTLNILPKIFQDLYTHSCEIDDIQLNLIGNISQKYDNITVKMFELNAMCYTYTVKIDTQFNQYKFFNKSDHKYIKLITETLYVDCPVITNEILNYLRQCIGNTGYNSLNLSSFAFIFFLFTNFF